MLTSSVICDFISLFAKRNVKKLKKKKKKNDTKAKLE